MYTKYNKLVELQKIMGDANAFNVERIKKLENILNQL